MTDVKPTRSELIKIKKKIKLAKSGYNLLKKKRDGLILEFFETMKHAKTLRIELVQEYKDALYKMNIARTLETDMKIKSMSMAIQSVPEISVQTKNLMGVLVPKIDAAIPEKSIMERGYGIIESAASIDQAAKAYEQVLKKTVKAAEIETTMKRLLIEIEKTKRRVNALEFSVIPTLKKTEKFIKLRLEEMERENVFRLKRIKK